MWWAPYDIFSSYLLLHASTIYNAAFNTKNNDNGAFFREKTMKFRFRIIFFIENMFISPMICIIWNTHVFAYIWTKQFDHEMWQIMKMRRHAFDSFRTTSVTILPTDYVNSKYWIVIGTVNLSDDLRKLSWCSVVKRLYLVMKGFFHHLNIDFSEFQPRISTGRE